VAGVRHSVVIAAMPTSPKQAMAEDGNNRFRRDQSDIRFSFVESDGAPRSMLSYRRLHNV
jgi:hypothetical protein